MRVGTCVSAMLPPLVGTNLFPSRRSKSRGSSVAFHVGAIFVGLRLLVWHPVRDVLDYVSVTLS